MKGFERADHSRAHNLTRGEPSFGRDGLQQMLYSSQPLSYENDYRRYSPEYLDNFEYEDEIENEFDSDSEEDK